MKFRDYFDRIRIISLASRTDRRREVTAELRKHGMPLAPGRVEFFDGVRMETDGGFSSIGMHGCFLSHLGVFKASRDAGLSRVLVLEDDFQLTRKFDDAEDHLVELLKGQPWDIVYFGHIIPTEPVEPPTLIVHKPEDSLLLAHCYAINSTIFDRLIAFMEAILTRPPGHPDCGPMSPDGALSEFRARNPDVVTLIASPSLCRQRSSRTDNHQLQWYDRTPVVRDVVGGARSVKSWVRSFR